MTDCEDTGMRMKRRCFVHDYRARSIYMVTIEVKGRERWLGRIVANAPYFEASELGRRVAEEFMAIGAHVPGVRPLLAQAMPDHFHGILFVEREIGRSLGSIVAGFKGKCSQVAREIAARTRLSPDAAASGGERVSDSLWEKGYHDRILTSKGQLAVMLRYVRENPRRAAIKAANRALFTERRELRFGGRAFDALGNFQLMEAPFKTQVQCSRRFCSFKRELKAGSANCRTAYNIARDAAGLAVVAASTPEFAEKRAAIFAQAEQGAVLVSPCISDGEKAIAYEAVDRGARLIVLRNEPFPPMFKPSGKFFDACAEGRLLILHPRGEDAGALPRGHQTITRAECLQLNAIVAEICGG